MTSKENKLYFVTWPNGTVVDGSPATDEQQAIRNTVNTFLPEQWFGNVYLGNTWGGPLQELWKGMKSKGFKSHEIFIPDGIIGK